MERKAGLTFITDGCLGGSWTGVLGSENPSSSSMVIGLSIDPSSQEKRKSSKSSRVRSFRVVHSHMLSNCISPSWLSVMGTCVIWCSLKSLRVTSTMCQTCIWMSIRARKNPPTVSHPWTCTKSAENSTENIRSF